MHEVAPTGLLIDRRMIIRVHGEHYDSVTPKDELTKTCGYRQTDVHYDCSSSSASSVTTHGTSVAVWRARYTKCHSTHDYKSQNPSCMDDYCKSVGDMAFISTTKTRRATTCMTLVTKKMGRTANTLTTISIDMLFYGHYSLFDECVGHYDQLMTTLPRARGDEVRCTS